MFKLKQIIDSKTTLDSKVFSIVLVVGAMTTFISTIVTFFEGLGWLATLFTFLCFIFIVSIGIIAYKFDKEKLCHSLLCIFLNFVLVPITFFACGGVKSGMSLYCLTCLYVVVHCITEKNKRIMIFVYSVVMYCLTIYTSTFVFPDFVAKIEDNAWYIDVIVSLILNAFCLYYIAHLTVVSYETERYHKEKLLNKLESLAIRDELTGLYNRRVLFEKLSSGHKREVVLNRYIVMLDIDNFKKINDTYGHIFGDKVLQEISKTILENIHTDGPEFAARYGGEEFIYVLFTESEDEAYNRADNLRKIIYDIKYDEYPDLHISISCGLTHYTYGEDIKLALKRADELLYIAKKSGKNRLER